MRDDIGQMLVAGGDVGIAAMLVEVALWLVEGDGRQLAVVDRLDELGAIEAAVPQMLARAGVPGA